MPTNACTKFFSIWGFSPSIQLKGSHFPNLFLSLSHLSCIFLFSPLTRSWPLLLFFHHSCSLFVTCPFSFDNSISLSLLSLIITFKTFKWPSIATCHAMNPCSLFLLKPYFSMEFKGFSNIIYSCTFVILHDSFFFSPPIFHTCFSREIWHDVSQHKSIPSCVLLTTLWMWTLLHIFVDPSSDLGNVDFLGPWYLFSQPLVTKHRSRIKSVESTPIFPTSVGSLYSNTFEIHSIPPFTFHVILHLSSREPCTRPQCNTPSLLNVYFIHPFFRGIHRRKIKRRVVTLAMLSFSSITHPFPTSSDQAYVLYQECNLGAYQSSLSTFHWNLRGFRTSSIQTPS